MSDDALSPEAQSAMTDIIGIMAEDGLSAEGTFGIFLQRRSQRISQGQYVTARGEPAKQVPEATATRIVTILELFLTQIGAPADIDFCLTHIVEEGETLKIDFHPHNEEGNTAH